MAGDNHYIVERPSIKNFYMTGGQYWHSKLRILFPGTFLLYSGYDFKFCSLS